MSVVVCSHENGVLPKTPTIQDLLRAVRSVPDSETLVALITSRSVMTLGSVDNITKVWPADADIVVCGAPSMGFVRDIITDAADSLLPTYPTLVDSFVWWKQRWSEVSPNAKFKRVDSSVVIGRARSLALVLAVVDKMGIVAMDGVWRWYTTIGQFTRAAQELGMPKVMIDDSCSMCAAITDANHLFRSFSKEGDKLSFKHGGTPTFVVLHNLEPNNVYDYLQIPRQSHVLADGPRTNVGRVVWFPLVCLIVVVFVVSMLRDSR